MQKEELIQEIETAFKDVTLEDGIGINEADSIEMGERDATINKGRNQDRSWWNAWTDIEDKYISSYSSAMDFMDSQGIKWVLPAYMIYIIKHYKEGSFSIDSTIYILEEGAMGSDNRDLYTMEQKKVIAKFLQFMITVGEEWVDVGSAEMALVKIWEKYL
ncbi:DUF6714 family protein [Sulfurovum sp.]|uniref:DUF6714 family protein n=1 Tax=Sulfurovum sp. TaxID=1969726 RepID=UPI00286822D8|nr:DUF6714 family protein [Sulfurovum sp.]